MKQGSNTDLSKNTYFDKMEIQRSQTTEAQRSPSPKAIAQSSPLPQAKLSSEEEENEPMDAGTFNQLMIAIFWDFENCPPPSYFIK